VTATSADTRASRGGRRAPRRGSIAAAAATLVVAAFLPGAPPAAAGDDDGDPVTVDGLLAAFAGLPGLHARFVEEKHLAMLAVPLEGRGEIFFAPPDRLLRRVDGPTPSEARIVGERLTLRSPDGEEVIDLSRNRVVGAFVHTFRNVLAGDRDALARDYRLDLSGDGDGWRLALTPRGDTLKRFLTRLILEGDGVVLRRMTLVEPNGDETRTRFSDIDPDRRFSPRELDRLFR